MNDLTISILIHPTHLQASFHRSPFFAFLSMGLKSMAATLDDVLLPWLALDGMGLCIDRVVKRFQKVWHSLSLLTGLDSNCTISRGQTELWNIDPIEM